MFPPCLRTIEMHSPTSHSHAWQICVVWPWLVHEAVVNDAVHAVRVGAVALRLDAEWRGEPAAAVVGVAGERLRRGNALAPDV